MAQLACELVQRKSPQLALSPSWCVLCKKGCETLDHLLLHCSVAGSYWVKLLIEADFAWVYLKVVGD
ncbi:hypothetical protein PanWU01x14_031520 [Parasponia andersonii]|uniref:Reverse transcriptase zinc-binding domain-containing protein n=1 Tax=Parasponia andersonii TaxID=3476 RepID=A0A2P5DU53_PARAD|nr:hypothetical protein PanWU01x14_031520 [Parasponia andersonii]